MIRRSAEHQLEQLLGTFPAVGLLGPRQVGKTTLALELAERLQDNATYLDLELPSDANKLRDPELYFRGVQGGLTILDEIQRVPGLFRTLRSIIDSRRRRGQRTAQFLILGSASVDLLRQSSESLAGRIAYLELGPFTAIEVGKEAVDATERLWVRGGFPESFLAATDDQSELWRSSFIQTYLERDIPALGPRVPAETLRRFWTMLAHEQGSLLNSAKLASALGVSGQTVARYVDLLVDLLLVRRLQPWSSNVGKRLVRSPKVYVRDSGLVHALLGLRDRDTVLSHSVAGASWEGFVIENLLGVAPKGVASWFYRTSAGAEIDLLLELPKRGRWAIEIKRSLNPTVSKGFYFGCEDVKATTRWVVYPGSDRYRLDAGIEALPLLEAMRSLGNALRATSAKR
jgi:predicted AAA+ superfamily ATPase